MRRRISNSPLIDPTVCAVIMMAPAAHDLLSISPDLPARHHQTNAAIAQAAGVLDVPIFTLLWRPEPQDLALAGEPSHASPRQFLLEEYQCPWFNRAFVEALSSEDSSVLIVGGFWLEHEILGTALHALAACYEVAILADITPPRQAPAAHSARRTPGAGGCHAHRNLAAHPRVDGGGAGGPQTGGAAGAITGGDRRLTSGRKRR